jgi:hypothetical protein
MDSLMKCHGHHLFETESIPQENQRLEVPQVVLEAAIEGLREYSYSVGTELEFDLEGIVISEWEICHSQPWRSQRAHRSEYACAESANTTSLQRGIVNLP